MRSWRASSPLTLGALIEGYMVAQATAIEADSLATVGTHLGHFENLGAPACTSKHSRSKTRSATSNAGEESGRRGKVTGYTIRK